MPVGRGLTSRAGRHGIYIGIENDTDINALPMPYRSLVALPMISNNLQSGRPPQVNSTLADGLLFQISTLLGQRLLCQTNHL